MSVEVPTQCSNCPRVCGLQGALQHMERAEDQMIQLYMSDELDARLKDAGDMSAIARVVLDAQIESIKEGKTQVENSIATSVRKCIGSLTLKTVEDGVGYEVTLCRSEEPADDIENPLNHDREGTLFEIALVKRESQEQE